MPHDPPEGFALPVGARRGPNCGVTAVAMVTGQSFDTIFAAMAKGKTKSWKGRSTHAEREVVLAAYGVQSTDVPLPRNLTLDRWAVCYAKPGVTYHVCTGGHIQVVRDRWCADQSGVFHISQFWGRRKFVKRVTLIHQPTE